MGQGEFNGCNFEDVLWTDGIVSKWRATGDFAAGKIGDAPKPKPRYMYRSYFSKGARCLYHASKD